MESETKNSNVGVQHTRAEWLISKGLVVTHTSKGFSISTNWLGKLPFILQYPCRAKELIQCSTTQTKLHYSS